ncbi:putative dimethyl sulfoxide reductase chain YnfF [bioreactor metagenome]|uniref:Putative dimethyl sulfoxide reductase chain YnfF n=1 Tax=bioreactor metagenome TaxID=1076179 RepID=A0A644WRE2_9ZZZZ|nr:molybdopterin-dependent oxidoreductase [Desulfitobacterium hafniense]MEA5025777.1 molybdopterin-dependent oxidoreductase [Desulfitobacterium hafniense]
MYVQTTRNICTRNCYDTCSILAHVENGRLVKVSGDFQQLYTLGTLCSKGYSYVDYVYHPDRILYPLHQIPRGSGKWQRITWDEAIQEISAHILKIYKETGNFLPLAFLRGTGSSGVLAQALLYMLSSLGSITEIENLGVGVAGQDSCMLDFGKFVPKDPEEMKNTDLVILWGVNPASTAIHQMRILQKIRREDGKVILIDVFPSRSVNHVDDYIQIRPGGDGALALAILRELLYKNSIDYRFIIEESEGWENFRDWLLEFDPEVLYRASGISREKITFLADKIRNSCSAAFWIGKGLQFYSNSGQNIRAIQALAVAGGLMEEPGGGVYTAYNCNRFGNEVWQSILNENKEHDNRRLSFQSLTTEFAAFNPGVRMLWVTQSNPLAQGIDLHTFRENLNQLELIVTTEHFLTETARISDIVLPATTLFETEDIVIGRWHKWLGLNEQAIQPLGESRSELEIARELSRVLNKEVMGICPFPDERTSKEWLNLILNPQRYLELGIENYEQLKDGPRKIILSGVDLTPEKDKRYRFLVPEAIEQGWPEIPSLVEPIEPPASYPYRFICVHKVERFNSQLGNLSWLREGQEHEGILLGEELAQLKGIVTGNHVTVYNQYSEVVLTAKVSQDIPDKVLICTARQDINGKSINNLVSNKETDLKRLFKKFPGFAYHDCFVNVAR